MDISTIVGVVAALAIVFTVQILDGGSPASVYGSFLCIIRKRMVDSSAGQPVCRRVR